MIEPKFACRNQEVPMTHFRATAFLMILCAFSLVFAGSEPPPGKVQGKFTADGKTFPLQFVYARKYQRINYEEKLETLTMILFSDQKLSDSTFESTDSQDWISKLEDLVADGKAHVVVLRVDAENNILSDAVFYNNSMIEEGFAMPWTVMTVTGNTAKARVQSVGKKAKYQYDVDFEVNVVPLKGAK